jgi:hypothetical protein
VEHTKITRIDGEYGIIQPDGPPAVIEYSMAALDEVRASAARARAALAHGGVETGGVLFGRIQGAVVTITAVREASCEHALGPAFALSERDEAAFSELLDAPSHDAALAGTEPVGWYRSVRNGNGPSERDSELHARRFRNPSAVALLVWPENDGRARATFFARGDAGSLRPVSPEFTLEPLPHDAHRAAPPPTPVAEDTPPAATVAAPPREQPGHALATLGSGGAGEDLPPARRRSPWLHPAPFAMFAIGLVLGALVMMLEESAPKVEPLGLRVQDASGQLFITWQRTAAPLARAARGLLEVNDGPRTVEMQLDPAALRSGAATYARTGAAVAVRLRVFPQKGEPTEEFASFVGDPLEPGAADGKTLREQEQALRRNRELTAEAEKLRRTVHTQATRINQLEDANRVLRLRAQTEELLRRRRE